MKLIRLIAILVGFGTVIWQITEAAQGRSQNMFFIADIIAGLGLGISALVKPQKTATILMLIFFALISGIFMVATFGALTMGTYAFGPMTTTIGLIASIPCIYLLAEKL